MLFLKAHIAFDILQIGRRDAERAVGTLPLKANRRTPNEVDLVRRRAFDFADKSRNRQRRRNPNQSVNVVKIAAKRQSLRLEFVCFGA